MGPITQTEWQLRHQQREDRGREGKLVGGAGFFRTTSSEQTWRPPVEVRQQCAEIDASRP